MLSGEAEKLALQAKETGDGGDIVRFLPTQKALACCTLRSLFIGRQQTIMRERRKAAEKRTPRRERVYSDHPPSELGGIVDDSMMDP